MTTPAGDEPFSLIDITRHNPWWDDETELPARTLPRTDLYWRVKNTLENDLVLIPGATATGTTTTLRQITRALVLGEDHQSERIQRLFRDERPAHVASDGCAPGQVCLVPCSDPLAHLVDEFLEQARQAYHPRGARTGAHTFYLLLPDIHRLEDWQSQLREMYRRLQRDFPEERWTAVASVPVARLAHQAELGGIDAVEVDLPHHTQKYRDTLVSRVPGLADDLRGVGTGGSDTDHIDRARTALQDAATGDCAAAELEAAFETIDERLTTSLADHGETLAHISSAYLTEGGFAPALSQRGDDGGTTYPVAAEAVQTHVTHGLATTLYQEVPLLAKRASDIPRVDAPEDLHALIAFLARRSFRETTYVDLGEVLSCDTRTIRQKFVPILEHLHIGERATRYDLVRNRTLRFYLRSPGYLTAFRGHPVRGGDDRDADAGGTARASTGNRPTERDYDDRLRVLLADHLRRLLASIGDDELLQYWRDDDHLVDFIVDVDDNPVLFVSAFTEKTGGTAAAFDAFAEAVESHHLEVLVTTQEHDVAVERVAADRLRLTIPHWVLLTVC